MTEVAAGGVWHDVAGAAEVVEEAVLGRVAGGVGVALFRLGEEVFALHDQCSHGYARLSDGFVEDGCVECPLHQGLVDIRTGAAAAPPITEGVRVYAVRIVGGRVEVLVQR